MPTSPDVNSSSVVNGFYFNNDSHDDVNRLNWSSMSSSASSNNLSKSNTNLSKKSPFALLRRFSSTLFNGDEQQDQIDEICDHAKKKKYQRRKVNKNKRSSKSAK